MLFLPVKITTYSFALILINTTMSFDDAPEKERLAAYLKAIVENLRIKQKTLA
jgi:hypothetical protein